MKELILLKSFNPQSDPIIIQVPIIQGGMGIGVSWENGENYNVGLPSAVCREGGLGVTASVSLDLLVSQRLGLKKKLSTRQATRLEIELIKKKCGGRPVGINIMRAIFKDWEQSILGALDGGVDVIISGAGLPLDLPSVVETHSRKEEVSLIPIVASVRALSAIQKRWNKKGAVLGGVVVEGPLAGGHVVDGEPLEDIFPPIKKLASSNGNFPVIVAGGIRTCEHLDFWMNEGVQGFRADGVQMGSIFAASSESAACALHKRAIIKGYASKLYDAKSFPPGSPCGLVFRAFKASPMLVRHQLGQLTPVCRYGYVATKDEKGNFTICPAKKSLEKHFCVCDGLINDTLWSSGAPYKDHEIIPMIANKENEFATVKEIFRYFLNK